MNFINGTIAAANASEVAVDLALEIHRCVVADDRTDLAEQPAARRGQLIQQRLQSLLSSSRTDSELVEELFLSSLSRRPRPEEMEVATRILKEGARKEKAEDLQWALLNTVEFLLNH
jgi:hypothetical protein